MNSPHRKTLVLGASEKPTRFSHKAALRLLENGEEILLLGKKPGEIAGKPIETTWPKDNLHTITLYLNPMHQKQYYRQIIDSQPKRVIFNPGTENQELEAQLKAKDIYFEHACTLVLLATSQY
ncbi:CoA-binding protein [bacterium]|nr:CoA-binding protein [bacterium]